MSETLKNLKRTHKCAEVTETLVDKEVVIMGWVNKKRNMKGFTFLTIRDISGIVQVVFQDEVIDDEMKEKVTRVRGEFVVAIKGIVNLRTPENINPDMVTGKIEVVPSEFRILSEAETPPFTYMDTGAKEEIRLRYRYIDLRNPKLQNNLMIRNKITLAARNFYGGEGFTEVETPILLNSSPEGARDYLVPSRIYPGNFYALPQSPQLLKQLLMVSGMDRYFQICKCFRDEDLRADRQPEFSQIDVEMSFVDIDDVIGINEKMIQHIFKQVMNFDLELPIKRITYKDAMENYGSDKPDVRFGFLLKNITDIVKDFGFIVFDNAINDNGSVRGINVKDGAKLPRKQVDSFTEIAKSHKAKGLVTIAINENGEIKSSLSKNLSPEQIDQIIKAFDGQNGDLILIAADKDKIVFNALGSIRTDAAKKLDIVKKDEFGFVWVMEFPLFEWNEDDNRFYAAHHPFTSPMDEDVEYMLTDPARVRAKAYDLAINGYEAGGGSVRIYQREVQETMFKALGFTKEQSEEKFGFLLDAFKYGAPPHGGIAFGLDRLCMIMVGTENIRDVIAFPKTKEAACLLTNAPNKVSEVQLDELGLKLDKFVDRNLE